MTIPLHARRAGTAGDTCRQKQKRVDDAVNKAKELLKTLPKDSKQYAEVKKALDAIGSRGDKNGVKIDFGKTATGGPMERNGQHITVDWAVFDKGMQTWQDAGYKPDPTVAAGARNAQKSNVDRVQSAQDRLKGLR